MATWVCPTQGLAVHIHDRLTAIEDDVSTVLLDCKRIDLPIPIIWPRIAIERTADSICWFKAGTRHFSVTSRAGTWQGRVAR
jgi:hypothetical protein